MMCCIFLYDSCVAWKRGKLIVTIHDVKPLLFGSNNRKRNLNTMIESMVIPKRISRWIML